jgi:arylformamidase
MVRVIDLSFPIDEKVSSLYSSFSLKDEGYAKVFLAFGIVPLFTHEADNFSMQKITLPSHTPYTAHIDAPYHELRNGKTIDQIPVDRFLGSAIVLDARSRKGRGITPDSVNKLIDDIQENDAILIRTDWYKRYGTPEYFAKSPFISMDLAKIFVEKKVRCVGIDFPIPEDTERQLRNEADADKPVIHYLLLKKEIYIIESMANFHKITQKRPFLITLPLNIAGADGFPVRAVAVEGLGTPQKS